MQELNKKRSVNIIRLFVCFCSVVFGVYFFSSCDSKNDIDLIKEVSLGVKKVIAGTTDISLEGRENYELSLDLKKYEPTIVNNSTIYGEVAKDTFYFNYIEGEIDLVKPVIIYLSSKEYGLTRRPGVKESPDTYRVRLPNIVDQNTKDGFLKADLLFGLYQGSVSSEINGIDLNHANALLHFKVIGQEPDDKVIINDLTSSFSPFKVSPNEYYAIVTGDWLKYETTSGYIMSLPEAYILINNDNNPIRVDLPKEIFPIKSGEKYKFNVRIDRANGKAEIEEIAKSVWDNDVI